MTKASQIEVPDKDLFDWLEREQASLEFRPSGSVALPDEYCCIFRHRGRKRYLYGRTPRLAIIEAMQYIEENSTY